MAVKEKWINTRPIACSTQEAVEHAISIVRQTSLIKILYLYGSRVSGTEHSDSDIDFAFYSVNEFTWDDYYEFHGVLASALHSDRFNLVWMNKAEPVIIFDVITTGKVLYYSDADLLNEFELKSKKNFFDYQYYLRKHRDGL